MPFLKELLRSRFEQGIESVAFQEVLNGTFICPPNTDPYVARLIASLKRHPGAYAEPWTAKEQISGWRKVQETTASLMSQVHFGHYMAGTFNPEIALLNATMADILLQSGYSPWRWRKGLNVMLQKQVGNINVEKLRIIVLFEVDFNTNNKWISRAVMYKAEQLKALAPEQYGSRKRKAANIQSLNKCLFYDMIQFKSRQQHSAATMPRVATIKSFC